MNETIKYLVSGTMNCSGQTRDQVCDTLYTTVTEMPVYRGKEAELLKYIGEEISPILSECYSRDSILNASLVITLSINESGRVIDVEIKRTHHGEWCRARLREKLRAMDGWSPGKLDGVPVCSKITLPIYF